MGLSTPRPGPRRGHQPLFDGSQLVCYPLSCIFRKPYRSKGNDMPKMKLSTWLKVNWLKILILFLITFFVITVITLMVVGFSNFAQMESFSRKQFMAQMGIY